MKYTFCFCLFCTRRRC